MVQYSVFMTKRRRGAIAAVIIIIVGGVLDNGGGDGANARLFFNPPWASVYKVYVATDSVNMWSEVGGAGDFPAVESLTKDGLRVDVDITIRWRVSASGVVDLFRRFPALDWKERAIIPIIREAVRNLIVEFTAIETIERRAVIDTMLEHPFLKLSAKSRPWQVPSFSMQST